MYITAPVAFEMLINDHIQEDQRDRLLAALSAISALDPVLQGEALLDEISEWMIRLSGLRV